MAPTYQGVDVFELQVVGGDMEPQEIYYDYLWFMFWLFLDFSRKQLQELHNEC